MSSRSYLLIQFENKEKKLLSPLRDNSLQYIEDNKLLQKGDSIVKHSYSDTLFVYRKDKVYHYFLKF